MQRILETPDHLKCSGIAYVQDSKPDRALEEKPEGCAFQKRSNSHVSKRRKLLNYLKEKSPERYQTLIQRLG